MGFNAGDQVVAVKDIGGFLREAALSGTGCHQKGRRAAQVLFTVHNFFRD